ncbi:MAG: glycosyltransferase [Candidatus Hydrogenedentes bacterium]|nr:glycosyltransferase [Candidatus Hydrogenedentota bacterium]
MPRLSVIMIVRNEAHCLGECLESIAAIADEIVVADTGSTDNTCAIAEAHGARVFFFEWVDDFAAARNATIRHATGEWLLHMDADEVVAPEDARRIRAFVDRDGEGADALELILANYCDEPRAWRWQPADPASPWRRGRSGYLPVPLLRLFRNGQGFEYREPVHENITESLLERGGRIASSDIVIHHYGYGQAGGRGAAKAQRYLAIARRKAAARPQDVKAQHDLAEQALACGDIEEAESAARQALAIAPDHLPAITTLANLLLLRGDTAGARVLLEAVIGRLEAPPHLLTALGTIDLHDGYWDSARQRFTQALQISPGNVLTTLYYARLLDLEGHTAAARETLDQVRRRVPGLEEIAARIEAIDARQRGERQFAEEKLRDALATFVAALRLDAEDPQLHNDLGVVLHALGEPEKAGSCFRRAIQLMPAFDPARDNLKALDRLSGESGLDSPRE